MHIMTVVFFGYYYLIIVMFNSCSEVLCILYRPPGAHTWFVDCITLCSSSIKLDFDLSLKLKQIDICCNVNRVFPLKCVRTGAVNRRYTDVKSCRISLRRRGGWTS